VNVRALRLDARMFSSRVARRAFVTFIACALLPVCALAFIAFQQVTSQLREQAEQRLHKSSKQMGMVLLTRLLAAEEVLVEAGEQRLAPGRPRRPLISAMWTGPEGSERALLGEMAPPTLTAGQAASVAAGKTVLSTAHDATGRGRVVVSRAVDPALPHRGVVHGVLDPAFLWVLDGEVGIAADTKLVVLDEAGRMLFSSFGPDRMLPEAVTRQVGQRVAGHFEWRDGDGEYLATHWALFLQATMAAPKWTIVVSQPKAEVFAPLAVFRRIFLLVVALTILIVVLLSGQQIRRSLTPLAQLKDGARRLALGDLGARVEVASRDEFADVATAFNDMAAQLGRQFHTLAVRREIAAALNAAEPLDHFLQVSADALTRHLGLPMVGIWLVGSDPAILELRAHARSAARPGAPPRLPLTQPELDRLRADRQPFVTSSLRGDRRADDLAGESEPGFVAFLAHPLIVDGRVVGLAGAYAARAFETAELSAFGLAAGDIAGGIDRNRVEAALRESETQTRQLQKMEAVGQLAGGIAHDFNNLLTVIAGRTYLLLSGLPPDHPHRKGIETIDKTAQRAALLTRQLLAFSRKQVLAPRVLDLNEVVGELKDILDRLIGETIDLAFDLAPGLGRAKLDQGQIEQVLVNLVVNARDAMPNGGRIVVETMNVDLDEAFLGPDGGGTPGAHVMVAVRDTGTGMDEQTRARIFEPFFTTKEVGKGTGLGLATVLGIVQQSGGRIRVDSQVGAGTTFRIYFPQVEDAAAPEAGAAAPPRGGSETVLVVDDEMEVQALLQTALTSWGYRVLGVTSPSEAIHVAEHHPVPIDLLVTDVVMPEMNGVVLAERLVAMHPDMATLFMSGYSDYSAEATMSRPARAGFLQKPFAPDAVARKVRDLLDAVEGTTRRPARADAPGWGTACGPSPAPASTSG
jgi:signal transduction histidine kinase/ActR/RegA family two-component response regulator